MTSEHVNEGVLRQADACLLELAAQAGVSRRDGLTATANTLDGCAAVLKRLRNFADAALASTAGAGAWRPMNTAPSDTPIVARHKPNSRTPHGWVATISRAPEDPDERVGGLDTILHYNGNALMRGFHGVWVGWMYPEEFAALALSAGTLSVGWDGARDAFARIVEVRAWTAEHGEPRAACLRAAADIRQAKAPAVPASPRSGSETASTPAPAEHGTKIDGKLYANVSTQPFQCPHCDCRSYARVSERKGDGDYRPGLLIRCVECKAVYRDANAVELDPPATAEHGVEIRAKAEAVVEQFHAWLDNPYRLLNAAKMPAGKRELARLIAEALSQGGGADRSERAVETLETIAAWCEETFGPIEPARIAERAAEEMDELRAEPTRVEEAADVMIVLSRYPGLWAEVQRKMAVNRQRKWRLMGDGTGYHVKPAPAQSPSTSDAEG